MSKVVLVGLLLAGVLASHQARAELCRVTSVKVVEIPWRFEVGIVQAALGGSWSGSASVVVVSSAMASSCM